jgi:peptidoglycan/LPS O-acetylase OafA/YrhL
MNSTALLERLETGDVHAARPAPLAPKPKNARYESLTLWRGVACLMLVIYHAAFYSEHSFRLRDRSTWTVGGVAISCLDRLAMGVPIFFVVSGYCIAASIDSLRRQPHSLRQYFWRRLRRIYPPLWAAYLIAIAVTLVTMVASASVYAECVHLPRLAKFSIGNWIGNLTASESWLRRIHGSPRAFLLPNSWTLCYEEQFYAVTGLLLVVAARRFFSATYVIAAAVFFSRPLLKLAGIDTDGFFFDGHWFMFAEGILVYECLNYFQKSGVRIARMVLCAAVMCGVIERVLGQTGDARHFGEYIFASSAFSIALIWLRRYDARLVSHPVLKPIVWCGTISYSIFLTHFPLVVLLACIFAMIGVRSDGLVCLITAPISVAITLPIAWVFHVLVERRFLNAPVTSKASA